MPPRRLCLATTSHGEWKARLASLAAPCLACAFQLEGLALQRCRLWWKGCTGTQRTPLPWLLSTMLA